MKASIYYRDNLIKEIDLNTANDEILSINGDHGLVKVEINNQKIGIVYSSCPLQYCVHIGLIDFANMPIICMYNGIFINIEGDNNSFDIAI